MDKQVEQLKEYMDESNYTVAITGSGISYLYGMTRFKQNTGRRNMTKMMNPKYIKAHPDVVYAALKDAWLDATFELGPSPVHYQLTELEEMGKIQGIVTQNLDYLHDLAGSTNVVAFMGSFADTVCIDCGARYHDINVWNEGEMPKCPECGSYLIPVFFSGFDRGSADDSSSNEWMRQAQDMIGQAELLIIMGTTGLFSDQYMSKLRQTTKIVQINPGSTVFDQMADLNIREDAEKVLGEIIDAEQS